jgi:transcriptional regulator with XRE-family HTH domain
MYSNSRTAIVKRLFRGRAARQRFVESHLAKGIAFQVRAIRELLRWSQHKLADEIGSNQNAIYRLESPDYGKATLTTLKKVAAAMDVALIVRFVPFSEIADWVSGTPRMNYGLDYGALAVPNFDAENKAGTFGRPYEGRRLERVTEDTNADVNRFSSETSAQIEIDGDVSQVPPSVLLKDGTEQFSHWVKQ